MGIEIQRHTWIDQQYYWVKQDKYHIIRSYGVCGKWTDNNWSDMSSPTLLLYRQLIVVIYAMFRAVSSLIVWDSKSLDFLRNSPNFKYQKTSHLFLFVSWSNKRYPRTNCVLGSAVSKVWVMVFKKQKTDWSRRLCQCLWQGGCANTFENCHHLVTTFWRLLLLL